MIIILVTLAVLETHAVGCVQLVGFVFAVLALVEDPETSRLMVVKAAADMAVVILTRHDTKAFFEGSLNLLFSQEIVKEAFIKTLGSTLKYGLFRVDCHDSSLVPVGTGQKDVSKPARMACTDDNCLTFNLCRQSQQQTFFIELIKESGMPLFL